MEKLLNSVEVAEILGVSRSWVYAAATESKILPSIKLREGKGGSMRFRVSDIEKFIADRVRGL